ncbi:MAG: methyltransferase domain-containing protein [Desulfobulbaceae bacterium]|nr:methyltransferase domain-containing protein [Desulfobulbaceae bacterium]
MNLDKKLIKQRFSKALATYDDQSAIQALVGQHLLALLSKAGCANPQRVLEIGCCTGLFSQRIVEHYPAIKELWCNDLVERAEIPLREKLNYFEGNLVFLPGDVESLTLPKTMDLVISSSTFHWFVDLETMLEKIRQILRPGSYLAFAMYGPDNLHEVRQLSGIGLKYPNPEELLVQVQRHFHVISYESRREELWFPDVRALLGHLRETGVNAVDKVVWTPKKLRSFINDYQTYFGGKDGVRATYHPIYYILRSY